VRPLSPFFIEILLLYVDCCLLKYYPRVVEKRPATNTVYLVRIVSFRYHQDPVSYEMLEYVSDFSSESCSAGIVAVAGNSLRILVIDNLGAAYNQTALPLRYTPRKMCRVGGTSNLVIVESDHNEYGEAERANLATAESGDGKSEMEIEGGSSSSVAAGAAGGGAMQVEGEGAEEEEEEGTVMPIRGPVPAKEGRWGSCVRVLDMASGATKCVLELPANEAAFSVCACRFAQHSEEIFVVVGTAKDLTLHPRRWTSCALLVYRLLGDSLQLLHRTEVEDVPMVVTEFQGRLLAGVGTSLRLYDMGKRKLLKKCEHKALPSAVVRLQTSGDRIFVGDMMESVLVMKYRKHENSLVVFADDAATRYASFSCCFSFVLFSVFFPSPVLWVAVVLFLGVCIV
jgi:splicing factor 3B subunit 3